MVDLFAHVPCLDLCTSSNSPDRDESDLMVWVRGSQGAGFPKVRVCKGESSEHVLLDGLQKVGVRRRQLRLLHREVLVKVAHVTSRFLKVK